MALLEAQLIELLEKAEHEEHMYENAWVHDSAKHIQLGPVISSKTAAEVKSGLEQLHTYSSTGTAHIQGKVILAQLFIATKHYSEASNVLSEFSFADTLDTTKETYLTAIHMKAYAVKAQALEGQQDFDGALQTYNNAINILKLSGAARLPIAFQSWIETLLYRASLLSLREKDGIAITALIRYIDFVRRYASIAFRLPRQLNIYRRFLRLCNTILKFGQDNHPLVLVRDNIFESTQVYEQLLMKLTKFPISGKVNILMLDYVDILMENWRLLGSDPETGLLITESMYNAAGKTFLSPRITRHLFYLHINAMDYPLALKALEVYLGLIDKSKSTENKGFNMLYDIGDEVDFLRNDREYEDMDTDSQIVRTICDGVVILIHSKAKEGKVMEMAQRAKLFMNKEHLSNEEDLALVWFRIGVAHSYKAWMILDTKKRPAVQLEAIEAFENSLKHKQSAECLYQLAHQKAEIRYINEAIEHCKSALKLEQYHIACWHLLSLLLSSRKDHTEALTICRTALNLTADGEDIDRKISIMELKITEIAIVEASQGWDAALTMQPELFLLYTQLFPSKYVAPSAAPVKDNSNHRPPSRHSDASTWETDTTRPNQRNSHESLSEKAIHLTHSQASLKSDTISAPLVEPVFRNYYVEVSKRYHIKIWLVCARLFVRNKRWDDAVAATQEAEKLLAKDPDILTEVSFLPKAKSNS